jgi:hypothetical protein
MAQTHQRLALNAMMRHRLDPESLGIVGRLMAKPASLARVLS